MRKTKNTNTSEQAVSNKYNPGSMIVVKLANNKPPDFLEKQGKDYILFGKKNEYPQYLLALFNQSAKHNAIVYQKSYYIAGGGYEGEIGNKEINSEGETLNEITKKSTLDFEIFGGFALEIIWKRGGKGFEIRHIDYSNIRSNKDNTEFYYTKNWTKKGDLGYYQTSQPENEDDYLVYTAFDGINKKGKQIYYFKSYRPGLDTYPLPEYMGAISYIELDYQIANYWYNAVKYGFAPSHIINFYNGSPTPEEQKTIERDIKDKFTGTDNAGKFILNFSDSKETGGSDIQNITPADLDKQFNILNQTIQEEIFSGHRITSPMLMGIKTPGQLGGRTELIDANELFQNIYVKPKQSIIEKAFGDLMAFNGAKEKLKLNAIEPIGLDLISSPDAWNMLTDVEKREEIGREPLPQQESIQSNELLTLINGVNPKVGEKILESLTYNDIRRIANLAPIIGGDVIVGLGTGQPTINTTPPAVLPKPNLPTLPTKQAEISQGFPIPKEMGACVKKLMDEGKPQDQAVAICIKETQKMSELKAISMFEKMGKIGGKRLASRQMNEIKFEGLADSENEFKQNFIDPNLRTTELSVLDLLTKNPLMKADEMAKVLKTDTATVNKAIESLKSKDLINPENVKSGDSTIISLTPVADASKILNQTPAPTEQIYIKYSYEWLPGFSDSDLKTSRDFCVKLREMSNAGKMWTREEIETISSESGMNVWEMRGGWYTKPDTNIHIPHCRHRWSQNIIHEAV